MSEPETKSPTETPAEPSLFSLTTPLFASAAMRAVFDDRARLQRMLEFAAMLSRAQASLGIVSASAVDAIVQACSPERYDLATLARSAALVGNTVRPLMDALTAQVARVGAEAAHYVNRGAAEQDIIDTVMVLELRAAIDVLTADLDRAIAAFAGLASKHRRQPMASRNDLQQGLPMPFGLKVAGYAAALARSRARLARLRKEALVLQFGGSAGTLAALGEHAFQVSQRLAALLDLPLPDAPWHSHRDRPAEVAAGFAILAGTCGKIARDVALLMQSEVGELVARPATGGDGTSLATNGHNPIAATAALAAATMAPNLAATIMAAQMQDHERTSGVMEAEWQTFPLLAFVASGALASLVAIAEGIEIDAERMRANLDATGGAIMAEQIAFALIGKIGKMQAEALVVESVQKAKAENRPLQDVLAGDERVSAHLSGAELIKLFEPMSYHGAAQIFIERQITSLVGRNNKRG